ncbi:MAG TPA: hypothetical protein VFO85_20250, partial [Vicinamibacteria bacterium]|nr:hypothetical protein [Vicinamibacteria bacterium]
NACQARSISLAYTPVERRHVVTVFYLDVSGGRVFAAGCPDPVWSVTPAGARVQPLVDGSREVIQGELIVTGAAQVYTVTAVAGSMTASLGVSAR